MNNSLEREATHRLVFSLLQPAIRLASRFGLPVRVLTEWVELAYFREIRQEGASIDEAGVRMDVSRRTAARLSKRLKEDFFAPEREHDLPRRLEFMLSTLPMTEGRIVQAAGEEREVVLEALRI
ncbi:MAG: hypothetical protein KDA28_11475, partial [Phycisphaerales bacterium]|nr:hypothetical protein [Phycisphaerales bacterium]